MSTPNFAGAPRKRLPVKPSEENLRKQAKRLAKQSSIALAEAQHRLANEYGCRNWAQLMHVVETMNRGAGQLSYVKYEMEALPKAANQNDLEAVRRILASGEFTQHDLDLALARSALRFDERGAIAQLLIEHGADPDGQYGSDYGPIVFVTGECLDVEGLEFLIAHGADVTFSPVKTKYGMQCPLSYWLGTYVRGRNERKHRGIEILLKHGAYVPPEVTPPVMAIHRGDTAELRRLIDADSSLLTRRFPDMPYGNIELRGATLLHCAVEFGEIECCEELFARHADINVKAAVSDGIGGQTPIYHAIASNNDGNFEMLQYLVRKAGQWIDMSVTATWRQFGEVQATPLTPLEYAEKAAREIDPKWAHFRPKVNEELALLRSLDRRAQVQQAIRANDVDRVQEMLDQFPDLLTPALWPAAIFQAQSLEITRLLLDRGLDPNQCSAPRKPLHLATDRGLVEVVRLLLEHGADPNVVDGERVTPIELAAGAISGERTVRSDQIIPLLRSAGATVTPFTAMLLGEDDAVIAALEADRTWLQRTGWQGFSPIFAAARAGRPRVVAKLLEMGVSADSALENGNTPLWFACQSGAHAAGRIAVAELLLDAGANPRRGCEDNSTSLHFAAWRGPVEMVELLVRRGAKEWQEDKDGKKPLDYARDGVAPDKEKIVELLDRPVIRDPVFREAVKAIQTGDLPALKQLLADHPNLVHDRAIEPDCYPQDYFRDPKLLWFVADNPNLIKIMPANTPEIAAAIIDAGAEQEDLSYTLELVMTSLPARKQNLQRPLMKLLLDRGATVSPNTILATLGHGEHDAVQALLDAGHVVTAPIAAGMGRTSELDALLRSVDPQALHDAFSMAVINRQLDAARMCLDAGADPNRVLRVHAHSTAAHQAAVNDDVPMLQLLVERGAKLDVRDTLWNGTPFGWAVHTRKSAAQAYLRSLQAP